MKSLIRCESRLAIVDLTKCANKEGWALVLVSHLSQRVIETF